MHNFSVLSTNCPSELSDFQIHRSQTGGVGRIQVDSSWESTVENAYDRSSPKGSFDVGGGFLLKNH